MEHKRMDPAVFCIHMVLFLAVFFSPLMRVTASAEELPGSIQMKCTIERNGTTVFLSGDEYALAQIARAEVDASAEMIRYEMLPKYSAYECDWAQLTASEQHEIAQMLSQIAGEEDYLLTGITDAKGQLVFDKLSPGLYLIKRLKVAEGNAEYIMDPFLVTVPLIEDGELAYTVLVTSKFEWEDIPDKPGPSPDPDPSRVPDPTPAPIPSPGEPEVPIDPEPVPGDPGPQINPDPEPKDPEIPIDPEPVPKDPGIIPWLPQTGQLNWPIPVLGVLGAVLIVAGLFLRHRRRKERRK